MRKKIIKKAAFILALIMILMSIPMSSFAAETSFKDQRPTIAYAEVRGYGLIHMNYSTLPGATGYKVYRAESKNASYKVIGSTRFSGFTDYGRSIGKVYYYKVRAYKNVNGEKVYSKYSPVFSYRILIPGPKVKSVQMKSSSAVTAKWEASLTSKHDKEYYAKFVGTSEPKFIGYKVYYSNQRYGNYKLVKTVNGRYNTNTTIKVSPSSEEHYIKVKAGFSFNGKKYYGAISESMGAFRDGNQIVEIENAQLKKKLVRQIGLKGSTVKTRNLINLTSLDFVDTKMTEEDLAFLKYCTGIKYLFISDAGLSNLEKLANAIGQGTCESIEILSLRENNFYSIKGIENFKNVDNIDLTLNPVSDFTPIASLKKLTILSCEMGNIDDDKPIVYVNRDSYESICEELGITFNKSSQKDKVVRRMINDFISKNINKGMTDYQKIKIIHDYIAEQTTYDINTQYSKLPSAYSCLIEHKGVCHDYAETFADMASAAGLEVYCVVGKADELHMWNIVKCDGNYYHLDCTWNDHDEFGTSYNYFLISDKQISYMRNYPWVGNPPKCPNNYVN